MKENNVYSGPDWSKVVPEEEVEELQQTLQKLANNNNSKPILSDAYPKYVLDYTKLEQICNQLAGVGLITLVNLILTVAVLWLLARGS